MADLYQYTMLITSLPHPARLFHDKQVPLSRLQLRRRLSTLQSEHARTLGLVEDLINWDQLPIERTDEEIIRTAHKLLPELGDGFLADIVQSRLELRTAVAALRRRHRGDHAPGKGLQWGYGRWVDNIRRNWNEPGFRLEGVFPWITDANRLLKEGDSVALERLLLSTAWNHLARTEADHYFDFEAVVIYVLRWNIIDRYSHYDRKAAADRFDEMVDAGLGNYTRLFR